MKTGYCTDLNNARKNLLIFFAVFILTPFFPGAGLADGPKIKIKPMVTLSSRVESNFFLTENNERDVYTLLLETPKTKVLFHYTLEAYHYDDVNDVPAGQRPADDNDYVGHLAALDLKHHPTERLTVGLDDGFYLTRYPTYYDRLSDNIEWRKYYINRLTPLIFYDFENKFSAGLRYRWTHKDYIDTGSGDFDEHRVILNLLYGPTRTTTFDLECQHWIMNYEQGGSDYTSNQVKLLFEKRYKYYAFDAGLAYHNRNFDDPLLADKGILGYKISILGENPPPPESRRRLGKRYIRAKTHLYIAVERNFNNVGSLYTAHRFTLDAGHVFADKINARVKGYYQLSDYETYRGLTPTGNNDLRDDRTYRVSASLGYLLTRRLELSIMGGIEERDSNLSGFSYDNRFAVLKFDFNFDLASRGGYTEESLYY
ncbi:MAG: outer membrane beta-barrel protein [Deltaproteobacteria bacterium]|nr:outer membrane beta-barrel protein [Deltaproteobacteria bacterium]